MKMIQIDRLKQVLNYDSENGEFRWAVYQGPNAKQGHIAGSVSKSVGYRYIKVDRRRYAAHRLAWFYVHGRWPAGLIDHKNTDRTDNSILNLREATQSTNKANRAAPKNNTSGIKGVSWCKAQQKWQVSICRQYKQTHLGFFDCKEDAAATYRRAAEKLFGEFARAS